MLSFTQYTLVYWHRFSLEVYVLKILFLILLLSLYFFYLQFNVVVIAIVILDFLFMEAVMIAQWVENGSIYAEAHTLYELYDKSNSETARYQGKFLPLLFNRFSSESIHRFHYPLIHDCIFRMVIPILRRRRRHCS